MNNTQLNAVLSYLKEVPRGITSMEAFELFGVTRLSAIIFTLRAKGYKIDTIIDYAVNRYGRKTKFATYVLVEEPKQDEE